MNSNYFYNLSKVRNADFKGKERKGKLVKICCFMLVFLLSNVQDYLYSQSCDFIPTEEIANLPTAIIKVNFHFFPDDNGETYANAQNQSPFPYFSGQWFAEEMVAALNSHCVNVPPNELPGPNGVFALPLPNGDSKIRFVIYPNIEEAVHYYPPGTSYTNYNSVFGDDVLDVLVYDEDPCGSGGGLAGANNTFLQLRNFYCTNKDISTNRLSQSLLLHEVFHTFGLKHSHNCLVKAFDIDPDVECHPQNPSLGCNDNANNCAQFSEFSGNNIMNGTIEALGSANRAITPGQVSCIFDHLLTTELNNFYLEDCDKTHPPLYLSSPTEIVWNTPKFLRRNVVIQTGTTLIIQCKTYMGEQARIEVRPGARLILAGGEIRPICEDKEWGGIHVNGNENTPHHEDMKSVDYVLLPNDPGIAILQGGVLRNAGTAISAKRSGIDYPTQLAQRGGLIFADGTEFLNNRRAVAFLKYDHPNKSEFRECLFESNRGKRAVTIWACDNIYFNRCTFRDQGNMDGDGSTSLDAGITLLDGGMVVDNHCIFEDLTIGIDCVNTAPFIVNEPVIIGNTEPVTERNSFVNNNRHIQASSQDLLLIEQNEFGTIIGASGFGGGGVRLGEKCGFTVLNNDFNPANLLISDTDTRVGIINENAFSTTNQFGAIVVAKDNHATTFNYNCFNNSIRIDVNYLGQNSTLKTNMGNLSTPYFNAFSPDHTNYRDLFIGDSSPQLDYFYHPAAEQNNPALIPRCGLNDVTNDCAQIKNFEAREAFNANGDYSTLSPCVSIAPPEPPTPGCITLDCIEDVKIEIDNRKSLIDDGATDDLLHAINYAPNSEATHQALLDASPYLSDAVLSPIISTVAISENIKKDILLNNAPLSTSMKNLAATHLSSTTNDELAATEEQVTFSQKRLLDFEISDLELEYSQKFEARLKFLSESNSFNQLEETLLFDGSLDARRRLLGLQFRKKDYGAAKAVLNALPEATLDDKLFKRVQSINLDFLSSEEEFVLTASQENLLRQIKDGESSSSSYARALLMLLKGEVFLVTDDMDIDAQQAVAPIINPVVATETFGKLSIYPNPASTEINIEIPTHFEFSTDTEFRMINAKGELVEVVQLAEGQYQTQLSTAKLQNGLYFIGLWRDGVLANFDRILISK